VQNDKEGMQAVVDWLNYTPKDFNSIAPHILNTADPPSRKGRSVLHFLSTSPVPYSLGQHLDAYLLPRPTTTEPTLSLLVSYSIPVEFTPSKTPYDPRHMLGGATLPDGSYVSGFFDKGTFKEYLGAPRTSPPLPVSRLLPAVAVAVAQLFLYLHSLIVA
jgi:hypothetical protein